MKPNFYSPVKKLLKKKEPPEGLFMLSTAVTVQLYLDLLKLTAS